MGRSQIVLLSLLLLVSFASADTPTQVNVTNSPPELIQNIPDVLVIMDTPKINAFDLDDYFLDPNGDDLIITHSSINNVTITINSENQVSFYPDANYSGVQNLQFTVSDGELNATSNIFQVTVGLDTIPPQWSNPRKSPVSVYQSYHVSFSADWTDNTGLQDFIFSINQGQGWQNQTAVEFSGLANKSLFEFQISAAAGTNISWTFYARDIYDNINKIDEQSFVVKQYGAVSEENPSQNTEDVTSDLGAGYSYGSGDTKLEYFKEGVLAENLEVDTRSIKISMKQGSNTSRVIKIINTGNSQSSLDISINNLDLFATLATTHMEIAPDETKELLIDFYAPRDVMPDQYFGFLRIDYGEKISIPIIINVKEFESEISIQVNLTDKSKAINSGENATALLTIKNLKDISTAKSQLYYAIKDFNGNIINSASEEISLSAEYQEEKTLEVPKNTPDGEYIFYARVTLEDSVDLDSQAFLVGARFKIISMLMNFFYPLTILLLLLLLLILYIIYKRNQRKKKLLELYLLLNQLRTLVKDGKNTEAINIYKRIKLIYGQHISKSFLEDESKLREELNKFSKTLESLEKKEEESKKKENSESKDKAPENSKPATEEKTLPTKDAQSQEVKNEKVAIKPAPVPNKVAVEEKSKSPLKSPEPKPTTKPKPTQTKPTPQTKTAMKKPNPTQENKEPKKE